MTARRAAAAVVVALLVAGVVLIATELIQGPQHTASLADPCQPRAPFQGSGLDGTLQRVVLDGLDGAACRLGTSRERLVLALAGDSSQHLHTSRATTEAAVRAGLLRSLDAAAGRGDVPALFVPLLRRFVQTASLDDLIRGAVSLRDLFG